MPLDTLNFGSMKSMTTIVLPTDVSEAFAVTTDKRFGVTQLTWDVQLIGVHVRDNS